MRREWARRLAFSQNVWNRSDCAIRSVASRTKVSSPDAIDGAKDSARGKVALISPSMSTLDTSLFDTRSETAFWIAGSLASGPTVSTYWSVSSIVLRAHKPMTEIGARTQPTTTRTATRIRRQRGARARDG